MDSEALGEGPFLSPVPVFYLLGNTQPGKEEVSRGESALNSYPETGDPELTPSPHPKIHGA